jgi:fatty acid desaturase
MIVVNKGKIREAHEPHWPTVWVWLAFAITFFTFVGLTGWAVHLQLWWIVVPLMLVVAHLMHGHIMAFHETTHGTLCPSRFWNELIGVFIGTLSLQSLTGFRSVHQTHHEHLASARDEELWPFVVPGTPRWLRRLAAACEMTIGIVYTGMLCLRTFLRAGSPIRGSARRRVRLELLLIAVFWTTLITIVALTNGWKYLLFAFVLPGLLAGNLHSWRKYIEHMGLTGSTVLSSTRSIVAEGWFGRLFSFSLFNINYHGVHHRYAKIPQARLPRFKSMLMPTEEGELAPYPNYRTALVEMLRCLPNPRIGAQWLPQPQVAVASEKSEASPVASLVGSGSMM